MMALPSALGPLVAVPRWVGWRWEQKPDGKLDKPPYRADFPEFHASTQDPKSWTMFGVATAALASGRLDGIGYVVRDDVERAFVDMDGCRDPVTGEIADWAMRLVEEANSYTEITPSKRGLRIIGTGADLGREIHATYAFPEGGHGEIYYRAARYVTVTGDRLPGTPDTLADISDVVLEMLLRAGKAKAGVAGDVVPHAPNAALGAPLDDVQSALGVIPNGGSAVHYDDWVRVALATYAACGGSADGYAAWEAWSAKSEKFQAEECMRVWQSIRRSPPRKIGFGTLYHLASTADPMWTPPSWLAPAEVAEVGCGGDAATSASEAFDPETGEIRPPAPNGLDVLNPTQWTQPAKPRQWVVPEWVPRGVVTALYGDGGMGKSLLAQQLMTSVAVEQPWLGLETVGGRALGIMCEDDPDELHRRQEAINAAMGITPATLGRLRYLSRVGADNIMMAFDGKDVGQLTPFFGMLNALCRSFAPDIVVCDTVADFFAGNENNRAQVRQFVQNSFGSLARAHSCAVVVCGHPSVSGIASGAGTGGSTAWNNTVRSRMYLTREDGEDVDPDSRVLSRKKANYAARDAAVPLIWRNGTFVTTAPATGPKAPDWSVITGLLDMIDEAWRRGEPWSASAQAKGRFLPDVARHSDKLGRPSKQAVARLLSEWVANGVVATETINSNTKKSGLKVLRRIDLAG